LTSIVFILSLFTSINSYFVETLFRSL